MYSISDLQNEETFQLVESFNYGNDTDSISFFRKYLIRLTAVSFLYFFLILIFITLIVAFTFNFGVYQSLSALGFALVSSVVYLVFHELIHAVCFLIVGGKNVKFKFTKSMIYTISDHDVYTALRHIFVALMPTVIMFSISIIIWSYFNPLAAIWFSLINIIIGFGDFSFLSFYFLNRKEKIYTFDDNSITTSFFYKKIKPIDF